MRITFATELQCETAIPKIIIIIIFVVIIIIIIIIIIMLLQTIVRTSFTKCFFYFYFTLKLQFLMTAAPSHARRTFATCMFAKILLKPHQKSTRVFP